MLVATSYSRLISNSFVLPGIRWELEAVQWPGMTLGNLLSWRIPNTPCVFNAWSPRLLSPLEQEAYSNSSSAAIDQFWASGAPTLQTQDSQHRVNLELGSNCKYLECVVLKSVFVSFLELFFSFPLYKFSQFGNMIHENQIFIFSCKTSGSVCIWVQIYKILTIQPFGPFV